MSVTNRNLASALGKVSFWKRETTRGTYISSVYSSANAVFLNAPLVPKQMLRKVDSRQQRPHFSKVSRISNRYGMGTADYDIPIKPSGALGTRPHGYQVLEGRWGKETVTPATSCKYEPLDPSGGLTHPSYTILVKYGFRVYLLIGSVVKTGDLEGQADDSQNVLPALKGSINFLRRYYVGKDEISGTEATGQTGISIKDARKFQYGYDSTNSVAMKVKFRTVAGVVDDNAGAGYTLAGVDVDTNTITITPGLAGAGLAANDIVEGFIPTPTDVGEEPNFYLGQVFKGEAGDEPLIITRYKSSINNNHIKIIDFEKDGSAYPTRIVDVGGNDNLRDANVELELVQDEDATAFEAIAENREQHIVKVEWGNVEAYRFYEIWNQLEFEAPDESGDQEIHTVIGGTGLSSGSGSDEGFMMFD